jgi:dTDP-4-dehydrorhamnose 3,5-epimerase
MRKHFKFTKTKLDGLFLIERRHIEDERGFFSRFFCEEDFKAIGLKSVINQINHTSTKEKGSIRGLHFQHFPHEENKIVSCLKGEVFDIAVDIRRNSPTYLKWHAQLLSEENCLSLFIPQGFAHGFQTLTDNCELIYLHTESYHPSSEGGLNALDPTLNISWPLEVTKMSERDCNYSLLGN